MASRTAKRERRRSKRRKRREERQLVKLIEEARARWRRLHEFDGACLVSTEDDGYYIKHTYRTQLGVVVSSYIPKRELDEKWKADENTPSETWYFGKDGKRDWKPPPPCHEGSIFVFKDPESELLFHGGGSSKKGTPYIDGIFIDLYGGTKAKVLTDFGFNPANDPEYRTMRIYWSDYCAGDLTKDEWMEVINYLRQCAKHSKRKDIPVVVQCLGGHGRTGTCLSILMCLMGHHKEGDPVKWLREKYCEKAVESAEQIRYIEEITGFKVEADAAKVRGVLAPWQDDLNDKRTPEQRKEGRNELNMLYEEWLKKCDDDQDYYIGKYGTMPMLPEKDEALTGEIVTGEDVDLWAKEDEEDKESIVIDMTDQLQLQEIMDEDPFDITGLMDAEREVFGLESNDDAWWCPHPCQQVIPDTRPCTKCGKDRFTVYLEDAKGRSYIE